MNTQTRRRLYGLIGIALIYTVLCPYALPQSHITNPPEVSYGTVAHRPSAVSGKNTLYLVTDGNSATDCSVGVGSTYVLCTSNGATWSAMSGGAGSMVYPLAPGIAVSSGTPPTLWGTSLTAPSGTLVGTTDTQTLTNKRITKRVSTCASAPNCIWVTPNLTPYTDAWDVNYLLDSDAGSTGITVNAAVGAPTDGQSLIIKIKSTNSQTITWTGFAPVAGTTCALPTATTGSSKIDQFPFLYDGVNGVWEYVCGAVGF